MFCEDVQYLLVRKKWKVLVTPLYPTLCDLWPVAHQAPLSMGFSSQDYWSGLPFPSPGDLPYPGVELGFPSLQADSLPSESPGKPSRANMIKRHTLHFRGLECKSRKSSDTKNNSQVWPWITKLSRERLTEFCQEKMLVLANILFQQPKRWLHTWTSPGGQYWTQIDYILCSQIWRSYIQSAKIRPGADCSSDHQLHIAKFSLKESRENYQAVQVWPKLNPYD